MPYRTCRRCSRMFYSATTHTRSYSDALDGRLPGLVCTDCRIATRVGWARPREVKALAPDAKARASEAKAADPMQTLFDSCAEYLDASKSVCLGEAHVDQALARRMLIQYMPRLKARGVEWIGLEIPDYTFRKLGEASEHGFLMYTMRNSFAGRKPGYDAVTEAAQRLGIKVVPIDYDIFNRASYEEFLKIIPELGGDMATIGATVPPFPDTKVMDFSAIRTWSNRHRIVLMNRYSAHILKKGDLLTRKYVILVGANHLKGADALQKLLTDQPAAIDSTTLPQA